MIKLICIRDVYQAKEGEVYYTDEDYFQAEYVIYNNLSHTLLPNVPETLDTLDEEFVKQVVYPGEKYVELTELGLEGYCLTSFGRVLNTVGKKQLTVRFSTQRVYMYVRTEFIDIPQIFEDNGWTFNLIQILHTYRKYKWKHSTIGVLSNNG